MNLQMSKIAGSCEYATGTLYQHFSCKEDLLLALICDTSARRLELFRQAASWDAPSRFRMIGVGVADVLFVRQHPEHFRLQQLAMAEVVWERTSTSRREAYFKACQPIAQLVDGIVRGAIAAGELPASLERVPSIAVGCFSLCLGMHSLVHADGAAEFLRVERPYRLMLTHMNAYLNGVGWKPWVDLEDEPALDALFERLSQEVFHDVIDLA